jgi:hypothetical protein
LLHVIKPELVNPFGKDFPDWKLNNQNSTTIDVDQAPTFESLQMLMLISGGQGISISFVGISFHFKSFWRSAILSWTCAV